MTSMRFVLVATALVTTTAAASTAHAQRARKAVRACGISAMPLTVDNQWVYEPVAHPTPLEDAQTKLLPLQPSKVTITVRAVEPTGKDGATVRLTEEVTSIVRGMEGGKPTERVDVKTVETAITCTATSMTISPESFWFAGEPGGLWNVTLGAVERRGPTLPITAGRFNGLEWRDDVKTTFRRTASPGSEADLGAGTIDLRRRMVFTGDEQAATAAGRWRAAKIGIETKGEIAVDDASGKPYLLPDLYSFLWLVDGVGIVLVHNSFVHAYQLVSFTVAK
jgi:hypothetical protein